MLVWGGITAVYIILFLLWILFCKKVFRSSLLLALFLSGLVLALFITVNMLLYNSPLESLVSIPMTFFFGFPLSLLTIKYLHIKRYDKLWIVAGGICIFIFVFSYYLTVGFIPSERGKTKIRIEYLISDVVDYYHYNDEWPQKLEDLDINNWEFKDGWGRRIEYRVFKQEASSRVELISFGSDNQRGGKFSGTDIVVIAQVLPNGEISIIGP